MLKKVLKLKKGTGKVTEVGKDYFWNAQERTAFNRDLARKEVIQSLLTRNGKHRELVKQNPEAKVDFDTHNLIDIRRKNKQERESFEKQKKEIEEGRKTIKPKRRAQLKPFRIFEGGPGRGFTKTLETIINSEVRTPNREFVIADTNFSVKGKETKYYDEEYNARKYTETRWEEEASKTGGQKLRNLTAIAGDATNALKKYPPKHFDIVFSSYLINNLTQEEMQDYLNTAFEKLRPGGRMIQINSYDAIESLREFALRRGMGFHIIPVSDELAKTAAHHIERRSTELGRRLKLEASKHPENIERIMLKYNLKSEDEVERPVAIILRKKKPLLPSPKQEARPVLLKPITKPSIISRVLNWLKI